jgi:8-oxo-dGTP diphosphatase
MTLPAAFAGSIVQDHSAQASAPAPPALQTALDAAHDASASGDRVASSGRLARPKVAVDTVLFAIDDNRLRAYLVQLRRGTLRGRWAFAGGLVQVGESLEGAARRELLAASGIGNAYLEQLFTFGDPVRDPGAHVVSVAYMALIADPAAARTSSNKYTGGKWFEVSALPELAYDHAEMARHAVRRLRSKIEYTNIACNLLPRTFTFAQFEALYALILNRPIDRRNFRRRILAMGLLRRLPGERRGPHRPAALYTFIRRSPQFLEML